ncbi:RraA family protein [Rhizobium mesoamericanum]|uniref:Putative 4-hydroxy-4-methyl-2-oxoglutarate aldolase n=1 Tax=Rhizobium mesoamericanum STM3625 TaxID=1211777 RepID=K0Q3M6_9HYPH|nr:demethylmenaquinone methyltransferase [Rhizobium mesoamericanum]CCM79475.1 Demethylmenaquinone methyltransferase protein [Rhizobium mesoamericanum STM3625]
MTTSYQVMDRHPPLAPDLVELLSSVETATIGHVEYFGFVGRDIHPLFPAHAAGVAVTVAAPGRDGTIIYKAIDLLMPGDILVISRVDSDDIACVGGGVATAAKAKGAAGIVIDGPCTDAEEIIDVGLPVWCRGVSSKTTNRRTSIGGALNIPIACGGAAVLPGYAVLADSTGVFVADVASMRKFAEAARQRQLQSFAVRAHLATGRSIFEFNPEAKS